MQKQAAARARAHYHQTFLVNIDGHQIAMTREQVNANGQGWKKCHGEHNGNVVHSLSVKRIGDMVFIKSGDRRTAGYDIAELAVALPKIKDLIDSATAAKA